MDNYFRLKQVIAILFSALLLLTPFLSVAATPACCMTGMQHGHACCQMPCCAAKNPDSQPAPAVPSQNSGTPDQISFLAFAMVAWNLPATGSASFSPAVISSLTSASAPIYARNCVRLI